MHHRHGRRHGGDPDQPGGGGAALHVGAAGRGRHPPPGARGAGGTDGAATATGGDGTTCPGRRTTRTARLFGGRALAGAAVVLPFTLDSASDRHAVG